MCCGEPLMLAKSSPESLASTATRAARGTKKPATCHPRSQALRRSGRRRRVLHPFYHRPCSHIGNELSEAMLKVALGCQLTIEQAVSPVCFVTHHNGV